MFVDDEWEFKCKNERAEDFLKKLMKISNGFCGIIGHETNARCIFDITNLSSDIFNIYNIEWNTEIKRKRNRQVSDNKNKLITAQCQSPESLAEKVESSVVSKLYDQLTEGYEQFKEFLSYAKELDK